MFPPTKLPGPDTIAAAAVCGPGSIVPLNAFTVIVSTWFAPTALVAVGGEIWMSASTQTFCAGPEFPAVPFVVRVSTTPFTVTVVDAFTVVVPATADVITTSHVPVPPDVVQFCAVGVPGPDVIVTVQVVPSGALLYVVLSGDTLTWQWSVWLVPTAFVAVAGLIWMFASGWSHVFDALPLPPEAVFCAVPVVRVIETPLTGMFDVACTTVTPGTAELIVIVQLAVAAPPVYVQLGEPTKLPGPDTIDAVAVCGPGSSVPPSAFTVIVSTWFVPTGFVAVAGVMLMFASTQFFVAGPEFESVPFVLRATVTPASDTVTCAETVVVPTTAEVRPIVQLPVPPVVVHGFGELKLPGPESMVKLICVPSGADVKPSPLFTFTCAVNRCVAPTGFVPFGVIWMFASTTVNGSHGPSEGVNVPSPA
jgi:hypothetical protein